MAKPTVPATIRNPDTSESREVYDARRALAEWELAREHNDWVVEQADDMADALAALLKMKQNDG